MLSQPLWYAHTHTHTHTVFPHASPHRPSKTDPHAGRTAFGNPWGETCEPCLTHGGYMATCTMGVLWYLTGGSRSIIPRWCPRLMRALLGQVDSSLPWWTHNCAKFAVCAFLCSGLSEYVLPTSRFSFAQKLMSSARFSNAFDLLVMLLV